jgi:transcriptional repressor NrdR
LTGHGARLRENWRRGDLRLEALVDDVEAELQQRARREVDSREIGELVLKHLRSVNEVAYVRFASVYRQFQGIQDFADALTQLHPDQSAGVPSTEQEVASARLSALLSSSSSQN